MATPLEPREPAMMPIRGPGDPGGGGDPPPSYADGTLIRAKGDIKIYLIAGKAKFWVPSPAELAALGLGTSPVVDVSTVDLDSVPLIPRTLTLLRERDSAQRYVVYEEVALPIPEPSGGTDPLTTLGLHADSVCVIPAGGLARNGMIVINIHSASVIPSSIAFPLLSFGHPKERFVRSDVPGETLPNGNRVVEIRGWLKPTGRGVTSDPDYHWDLEPDPAWLEHLGVDLGSFIKVGDILAMGDADRREGDWPWSFATVPGLHMEVNGWNIAALGQPPAGWRADGAAYHQDHTVWPYDPTASGGDPATALQAGDYVRVSGCLVTDLPHSHLQGRLASEWWHSAFGGDVGAQELYATAARTWEGAHAEDDEDNPARWSEMHPPDIIEAIPAPAVRDVWIYGVCVACSSATLDPSSTDREFTGDLAPPGRQPANTVLAVEEFVGGETRFGSIIEGNPAKNGAQITNHGDRVTIHVKVRGEPFDGAPGKFKAIYRLQWQAKGTESKPKEHKDGKDGKEKDAHHFDNLAPETEAAPRGRIPDDAGAAETFIPPVDRPLEQR